MSWLADALVQFFGDLLGNTHAATFIAGVGLGVTLGWYFP